MVRAAAFTPWLILSSPSALYVGIRTRNDRDRMPQKARTIRGCRVPNVPLEGAVPAHRCRTVDSAFSGYSWEPKGPLAADIAPYDFTGRTIKGYRRELREELGWRPCNVPDAEKLTSWLAEEVCIEEHRPKQVRSELLARCNADQIEPLTMHRIDTIVRSALYQGKQALFTRVHSRPAPEVVQRLLALVARPESGDGDEPGDEQADRAAVEDEVADILGQIKQAPSDVSLNSMLTEIFKLELTRDLELPDGLFVG